MLFLRMGTAGILIIGEVITTVIASYSEFIRDAGFPFELRAESTKKGVLSTTALRS